MFTQPIPFKNAIAALDKRGLLPLSANSAQISGMPAALLDEGFFSSTVNDARILQAFKDRVAGIVRPEGALPGASLNTATAREQMRQALASIGYAAKPGEEGTIKDLTSQARLDLVIDQNVAMARGRGQWVATQDEDILDMWPCKELFRAEARRVERNWTARWRAAGGQFYDGRMIARKDAPVWYSISRFGTPWPPYDFNSGMDDRDIGREEAVSLGVISNRDIVKPQQAPALAMTAALANLEPALVREVMNVLGGDRVHIGDGLLTFLGAAA